MPTKQLRRVSADASWKSLILPKPTITALDEIIHAIVGRKRLRAAAG